MEPSSEFADDLLDHPEDYYGLAYLDFEDSRYVVKKECVIIGRPPESHLTLAEIPEGSAGAIEGTLPLAQKKKRKRSDVDEDEGVESEQGSQEHQALFQGGLGGPQEHGASYIDEDAEFIYIWPPADDVKGQPPNLKAISKRHLRILFDGQDQWQLDVLGRNGVVINRDFFPQGSQVMLDHGDHFWVADVHFSFNIPDLEADEIEYSGEEEGLNGQVYESDEADSNEDSNDGVSADEYGEELDANENDEDDDDEDDDDDDDSVVPMQKPKKAIKRVTKPQTKRLVKPKAKKIKIPARTARDLSDSEQEDEDLNDDESSNEKSSNEKHRPVKLSKGRLHKGGKKPPATSEEPNADDEDGAPKKRGPGRPPKDGVMSKRARRALQKAAEMEREDADPAAGKVKGRPRKASESNAQGLNGEAKKPKKSKKVANDAADGKDGDDKSAAEVVNEEPAPPPPPREPSPKESDFQEHELQKPDKPYSVCLYNVLRESERSLALPEIYEAFKKRWPYFRFRTGGDGWQSSIRHNLQSTKCLVKDGKAGKGHLWTVDPNIPLDNRANNRSELAALPQGYYGQQGQNQHMPMRAPINAGFQGQQAMHQYHIPYMHTNAIGQRVPVGPNPPSQQYQTPANNNGTPYTSQNPSQFNASRNFAVGASASGIAAQNGMSTQKAGPSQSSVPTQQAQFNQPFTGPSNAAFVSNVHPNPAQMRGNGPQPGNSSNGHVAPSAAANVGTFSPEKLQVFDQFRNRLLGMAQNETQRKYYIEILDLGQAWCAQHSELGARYEGTRTDISQIVRAFQEAWEGHLKKKGVLKDQGQTASSSSSPQPPSAQTKIGSGQTNGISGTPSSGTSIQQATSQVGSRDANSKSTEAVPPMSAASKKENDNGNDATDTSNGASAMEDNTPLTGAKSASNPLKTMPKNE